MQRCCDHQQCEYGSLLASCPHCLWVKGMNATRAQQRSRGTDLSTKNRVGKKQKRISQSRQACEGSAQLHCSERSRVRPSARRCPAFVGGLTAGEKYRSTGCGVGERRYNWGPDREDSGEGDGGALRTRGMCVWIVLFYHADDM